MSTTNVLQPAPSPASQREFVFTRSFPVPRSLVFKAWMNPQHLAQWWGPSGFTNPVCRFDPRPGGAIYVEMRAPDGTIHPMGGEFREIVEPERLVFISAALDEAGTPMFEVLNTVTFSERDGETTLRLEACVISETPGADAYLAGMNEGWIQSLERLAAYVERD
jgi:uncharacterized protein YndB with AHSA1/START domain